MMIGYRGARHPQRVVHRLDCATPTLSADHLTHYAAHALALAALRWHGYRSDTRYLVFQCTTHTVALPPEKWRVLDDAHRKRNLAEYEGQHDVDTALVEGLVAVARELDERVSALGPPETSG